MILGEIGRKHKLQTSIFSQRNLICFPSGYNQSLIFEW